MSSALPKTAPEFASALPDLRPPARKARKRARSIQRQSVQCLAIAALAVASYFVFSRFVVQSVKVVGRSMVPTLGDSQYYLLNRWVYHLHAPRRSDVVVLRDPADNGFSVKRVIAAPGDSVCFQDGKVYVNGRRLNETYLPPGILTLTASLCGDQSICCGKDQFFVMGDNRANSVDSRLYGPVPRGNILGQLIR